METIDEEKTKYFLDCFCPKCKNKHVAEVNQHWYLKFRDSQPIESICDKCTKESRR